MMVSVRTNLVQNVPYSGASRNKFVGFSILLGVIYFVLDPHLIRGRTGSGKPVDLNGPIDGQLMNFLFSGRLKCFMNDETELAAEGETRGADRKCRGVRELSHSRSNR
jgi:hypothetical protein